MKSIHKIGLASLLTLFLASCVTPTSSSRSGGNSYFDYNRPASKPSNPSQVRVKVSLSNQMVYVMEGSRPLLIMPVSIGTTKTPTPKGNFRIFKKDHYHRANSHGFAYSGSEVRKTYLAKKPRGWSFKGTPMPYWCEFKTHYGFHTGWMKPFPCTHGCIRMHENVAPKFFALVRTGTSVSIAHSQTEDATIGRNIPRPPDASPLPDYSGEYMLGNGYFTKHKPVTFN